jgi:arylsulfatase A-like enzyme
MNSDAPNVLLIVLEGARPDHLSCAGYERPTTPFLDQVAREGVRFPNAFTTAVASPSAHASMLTGLFPSLHGCTEEAAALPAGVRLLPELLKTAGYRTAAFCPDSGISPAAGFGRGFDRFYTQRAAGRIAGRAADYARRASDRVLGRGDAGARRTTQALLDWVAVDRQPFFAFVHFREARQPIRPPAPYDRIFMADALNAARSVYDARDRGAPSTTVDEADGLTALHDGALRYIDLRLKQIGDALAATGRWDQTLLIVTAGYGENLGDNGVGHRPVALCDAVLRVPLIVRCPGRVPSGFVVEEFAQPIDLLPTVALLTGCALDAPVQGRALLTTAGATAGPRAVMVESFRQLGGATTLDVRRKVIRTRREKFIWQSDEANALFDLVHDPQERCDLAAAEPERADALRRELFDWLAESERWVERRGLALAEAGDPSAFAQRGLGE